MPTSQIGASTGPQFSAMIFSMAPLQPFGIPARSLGPLRHAVRFGSLPLCFFGAVRPRPAWYLAGRAHKAHTPFAPTQAKKYPCQLNLLPIRFAGLRDVQAQRPAVSCQLPVCLSATQRTIHCATGSAAGLHGCTQHHSAPTHPPTTRPPLQVPFGRKFPT